MPSRRVVLPGSNKSAPIEAEKIGPADHSETTHITVVVRRRAEPLPITAAGTRMHAHEYAAAYGASASDFLSVRDFAKEYNLDPRNENAATRTIELYGRLGDLARAFGVQLEQVKIKGLVYRVRHNVITIPEELAGKVVAVLGLDNRPAAKPHFHKIDLDRVKASAVAAALSPLAIAQLYKFPPGLDGSGQTIGIIELDGGFLQSDLDTYFQGLGLTAPSVSAVLLDGQTNAINKHLPDHPELNADDEVALDIEIAGAVAPSAKQIVYFAQNTDQSFLKAINTAVHASPQPAAISISWGGPEAGPTGYTDQTKIAFEQTFQDAANLGIPICVASGDNGSFDKTGALMVDFPASAPHALGCGGTKLIASGTNIASETVWNAEVVDSTGQNVRIGTGGGVSQFFAKPSYQSSVTVPSPPTGNTGGRGVPDVAGDADPSTGYKIRVKGLDSVVGGTSAVAPLWAGLIARLAQSFGKPVGFLHPKIYESTVSSVAFRDVTEGDNDSQGLSGLYHASTGWDPCTGLGSPKGTALLNALKPAPPTPTPHPPTPTPTPHPPTPTPTPHPPTPTPHPPTPTPHPPTPTPTPHPPTPTPTPTPTPSTGGTGVAAGFDFPTLPPAVPPPSPAPQPVTGLVTALTGGANAVALVGVVGLAAITGMVAAAGIVATVAIAKDK